MVWTWGVGWERLSAPADHNRWLLSSAQDVSIVEFRLTERCRIVEETEKVCPSISTHTDPRWREADADLRREAEEKLADNRRELM